jgi:protein TonB
MEHSRFSKLRLIGLALLVSMICTMLTGTVSAQDRVRISDAEGKKAVVSRVEPAYPPMARQMKISGHVEVDVEVSPEGHVEKVEVLNGNAMLGGACVQAVKQWKFTPFQAGGKPAATVVRLGFNFSL